MRGLLCFSLSQCLEKPRDKPPAAVFVHTTMTVQVLLQVGEYTFYQVVGVWHAGAVIVLERKEIREKEIEAVHCSA